MLFHQALWKPKGELVGEKPDANHPMTLKLPSIDCVSSFHLGFFRDWLSMDNPTHRAIEQYKSDVMCCACDFCSNSEYEFLSSFIGEIPTPFITAWVVWLVDCGFHVDLDLRASCHLFGGLGGAKHFESTQSGISLLHSWTQIYSLILDIRLYIYIYLPYSEERHGPPEIAGQPELQTPASVGSMAPKC